MNKPIQVVTHTEKEVKSECFSAFTSTIKGFATIKINPPKDRVLTPFEQEIDFPAVVVGLSNGCGEFMIHNELLRELGEFFLAVADELDERG